jgi:hypothetical protein
VRARTRYKPEENILQDLRGAVQRLAREGQSPPYIGIGVRHVPSQTLQNGFGLFVSAASEQVSCSLALLVFRPGSASEHL